MVLVKELEHRPSKIHGLGVFSTRLIHKDEDIPAMPKHGYNHSYDANMGWNEDFTRTVAYRDIQKDEELTINYIRGWMKQGLSWKEAEKKVANEMTKSNLERLI